MNEFPLELSSHVAKGRYANFAKGLSGAERLVMIGYEECAPDYIIDRSEFPFWTLECIAGGEGFYREEGALRRLAHGAVYAYGPGVAQRFWNEPQRPFRKYFMACGGRRFPESWRRAGLEPGRVVVLGNASPVVAAFDQMLDEGERSDAHSSQILAGLETVLLAHVARHRGGARGDRSRSRKVYDLAMEVLQREYRSLHSLGDLATRSGYSSEYLCRVFKRYHGDSPYQVLLHRKMSAAWLLLRAGQWQVGAVAQEVGFEDPLHFSKVFRKIMGCAPSSVFQTNRG